MVHENPDDVVRLTTARNPVEAHVLEQALASEGIESKVVGDYLDAGIGDVPGVRAEVWVHREDLVKAQEILQSHGEQSENSEEQESGSEPEP